MSRVSFVLCQYLGVFLAAPPINPYVAHIEKWGVKEYLKVTLNNRQS